MTARGAVVAIDQGTSSSKGVAVAENGTVLARARADLGQRTPRPGWVEQDPEAILDGVRQVLAEVSAQAGVAIAAVGLSTQRESAMAWDTTTGAPLSAVIGWQDRRTAEAAVRLGEDAERLVRGRSGLPLDPMFSALKFAWILDDIDPDRTQARAGRVTLGTVDAWLAFRLAGVRRIERGNASRTQLADVRSGEWSDELLELFDVPRAALPDIVASDAPGATIPADGAATLPLAGVLGDSHAALFGHGCRAPGAVKATYGTGSSVMGLSDAAISGVAETIAWDIRGSIAHAFEGNILATGAAVVWLAELLGLRPEELADLARDADDGAVDLVPAFAGLAAPWWDPGAVGTISGLTLGTTRAQLARAALESVALQIEDVLSAVEAAGAARISKIHVDGGPSDNDWLMQRQAELSGRTVVRPADSARSVLGAAWLAGAARGVWDYDTAPWQESATEFGPQDDDGRRAARRRRWHDAVARARLRPGASAPSASTQTERTIER
ncbi:FGGY family carbohydrate kinase [Gryllotalpicola koreensis]|uniref:ATP:glycerol 3-phosphotransferase n=1 Tax=Gryllotalpicola koreensis TaxID=993086 RepID=A0ABP7ZT77_9MICO